MKAFLTFFILYFFSLSVSAQQFKRIFLFNDFVQAQIKFRNHSVSVVSLNYDASNKTMLFRQGEEMMEMTNPAQVDTVIIGKRKFVPVGRGFYEVVCRYDSWFQSWCDCLCYGFTVFDRVSQISCKKTFHIFAILYK